MVKVPRRPPKPLHRRDGDVLTLRPVLWRIHRTVGAKVLPWNGFRQFGPVSGCRWDPHPLPPYDWPGYGVSYAATDLVTAVAEVFQTTRRVQTIVGAPYATSWSPTRDLRLLDLTGDWALRNEAAHALASASRPTCRAWARAIHERWDDLDGLWFRSTMTGLPAVVLFERAGDSMPLRPGFSKALGSSGLWPVIAQCAERIRYAIT